MDHKFDFCQVQFLKLFLSNAWIGFQEFAVYLVAEFSNSFHRKLWFHAVHSESNPELALI